jgi:predicted small lipoprotein YifL
MRNRLPAALLLCMPLLIGCGQKGPLYLPEPEKKAQAEEPEQQAEPTDEPEQKEN